MALKNLTHIRYRRLFFSVNDNFLNATPHLDADINYCIQCPENIHNALSEFHTLLIDLTQSVETIRENIYHRTLSEINSFLSNQTFEYRLLQTLTEQELDRFIQLFNTFAAAKKIRKMEGFRLKAYLRSGILRVSYIQQQNQLLCINIYRLTSERATNLYSFSPLNSPTYALTHTQLGRAHRALHWLDILEFKKEQVRYYDFCGWYTGSTEQSLLNINKFKEQFTKNKVIEYTGVIYKNKFLSFLLKLKS